MLRTQATIKPEPKLCRHCHKKKSNRPRGLCWTCFNDKRIRNQYPSKRPTGIWANSATHKPTPADIDRAAAMANVPMDATLKIVPVNAFRIRWGALCGGALLPWACEQVYATEQEAERAAIDMMNGDTPTPSRRLAGGKRAG